MTIATIRLVLRLELISISGVKRTSVITSIPTVTHPGRKLTRTMWKYVCLRLYLSPRLFLHPNPRPSLSLFVITTMLRRSLSQMLKCLVATTMLNLYMYTRLRPHRHVQGIGFLCLIQRARLHCTRWLSATGRWRIFVRCARD